MKREQLLELIGREAVCIERAQSGDEVRQLRGGALVKGGANRARHRLRDCGEIGEDLDTVQDRGREVHRIDELSGKKDADRVRGSGRP